MHYTAKFIDVFWLLTKNRTCTYHTPHTSNEWPTPGIHWLHPHGIQLYTITYKNIKVIKMIKAVDEVLPQDLRCSVLEKSFFLFFFSKLNGQLTEILLRNNMSTFDNTLYHHSRAPKKNTSYGNEVLTQDTMHLIQRPCYQQGSPCQYPAGNWTTRRPSDHRKETQTAVVWSCFLFIRYGQNRLVRHSERRKKTGVWQVPEGSGEQGKMGETGCKIICGAPTTLAVKEMMMMIFHQTIQAYNGCHPFTLK